MRTRRCSLCRKKVPAENAVIGQLRAFCSMEHLIEYARSDKGKKIAEKGWRQQKSEILKKQKTWRDWCKEAQKEFNAYIRARDAGNPCISCGRSLSERSIGGDYDCGHFRSVGSAPHLRFHTWNAHGQCKKCNRYLGGNYSEYRRRLLARIGVDKVETLEADYSTKNYTYHDLQRIIKICKKRRKRYGNQ